MTGLRADLDGLCRAARTQERASAEDRASVREGLRVRHGIALGVAAGSAVGLTATKVAEGAVAGAGTVTTAPGAVAAGAAKAWLAKGTLLWLAGGLAGGGAVVVVGTVYEQRTEVS